MQTTTKNAARAAAQAKPCQNSDDNASQPEGRAIFKQVVIDGRGYLVPLGASTACPASTKTAQLVLQAQDETESLRTVLRACQAVAALAENTSNPHSTISMEALGELLHLHSDAMDARLDSLGELIEAAFTALATNPVDARARTLAFDARDFVQHMRQAQLALGAVACMVPSSTDTLSGEDLGAALRLVIDAMATRAGTMDEQLDALHAELTRGAAKGGAA